MKAILLAGAAAVGLGALLYVRRNPAAVVGKAQIAGSLDGRLFADFDTFSEKYNKAKLSDAPAPKQETVLGFFKDELSAGALGAIMCSPAGGAGAVVCGTAAMFEKLGIDPRIGQNGPTTSCTDKNGKSVPCPDPDKEIVIWGARG